MHLEKFSLNFSKLSFSIFSTLITFWFSLTSSVFVYSGKLLFHGFLLFTATFYVVKNNSKYCDKAPLTLSLPRSES